MTEPMRDDRKTEDLIKELRKTDPEGASLCEELNSLIQAKELEVERLMKLEGYRQEQLLSLRTLVKELGKSSSYLADHFDYLISLLQKEPSMQNDSKWGEVAHGSGYRLRRLREALLLIPEELRKEIEKV